jgi:sulfotransferase family protein
LRAAENEAISKGNGVLSRTTVLPDFLIVGASKGGTVWMNECLREHPDVHLSQETHEIFFFDRYYDRGVDWYARYFQGYAGQKRVGDITSTYLADALAPSRVRRVLPDATLIASLRNPIDRAWSKYLHMWRKGQIPRHLSFWQACELAPGIIADGEYFRCQQAWRDVFPEEQLHLFVLDDARADPFAHMRRVYEALEIDPEFRAPSTTQRANEHRTPRSIRIAAIAYRGSALLHRSGLHAPIELAKRLGLERVFLHRDRNAIKEPEQLTEADRERLRLHYRDDVAALSELVGRDLIGLWLKPPDAGA